MADEGVSAGGTDVTTCWVGLLLLVNGSAVRPGEHKSGEASDVDSAEGVIE